MRTWWPRHLICNTWNNTWNTTQHKYCASWIKLFSGGIWSTCVLASELLRQLSWLTLKLKSNLAWVKTYSVCVLKNGNTSEKNSDLTHFCKRSLFLMITPSMHNLYVACPEIRIEMSVSTLHLSFRPPLSSSILRPSSRPVRRPFRAFAHAILYLRGWGFLQAPGPLSPSRQPSCQTHQVKDVRCLPLLSLHRLQSRLFQYETTSEEVSQPIIIIMWRTYTCSPIIRFHVSICAIRPIIKFSCSIYILPIISCPIISCSIISCLFQLL